MARKKKRKKQTTPGIVGISFLSNKLNRQHKGDRGLNVRIEGLRTTSGLQGFDSDSILSRSDHMWDIYAKFGIDRSERVITPFPYNSRFEIS